ncbi:MAG: hypothetical protein K2N64_08025 [Anaeroplasmataceae bacterium]|nr:hypothetical protein [Anaeroplasmataceae bacterium]
MKKRFGFILCLLIGLTLIGCKKEEQKPPVDDNPPVVVDQLKTQRETALKDLNDYVSDMTKYSSSNQAKIQEIIELAKKKITDALEESDILNAIVEAKKEIDEIGTLDEEALAKAITDAHKELEEYVSLTDYNEENQKAITDAIQTAKAEISSCTTIAEIVSKLASAKSTIDAIPTLALEALLLVKAEANEKMDAFKAAMLEKADYSKKGLAEIDRIIKDAKENITSATDEEIINIIVSDAQHDLSNVKTAEAEKLADVLSLKEAFVGDTDHVLKYISVDETKIIIDTKEQGSSIFHFGSQDNNKYVVFDTKLIADYRNVEHSKFSIYFRAWDTSNGYRMEIYDGYINIYSLVWDEALGGKVETLIMKNAYGVQDRDEVHIQIICHDLKKAVLINEECVFSYEEDAHLVGHIYFELWQVGLTLLDPVYTEYSDSASLLEDYESYLNKECINESEKAKLDRIKATAKAEIEGFITDTSLYSDENKAVIMVLIAEGKANIDACLTKEAIEEETENIKLRLSAVKTIEREAFEADAIRAKTEIEEYLTDLSNYSAEAKLSIADIISKGKLRIDAADSVDAIALVVTQVKADLDKVLNIDEENALKASSFYDLFEENTPVGLITNHIRVEDNKVIFDTAKLSATRLHFGIREDSKKWVVLDTKIMIEYQNVETSVLSIRFRAWDESHGYRMDIHNDFINVYACAWGQTDILLFKNPSFGIKNGEEAHIQILSSEWKKAVLINGESIFYIDEDERNVGYVYIETKSSGVTFINPEYAEYPNEEAFNKKYKTLLESPCINKSEKELLEELKLQKKTEIESYITDLTLYSDAKKEEIAEIISSGKLQIDACLTKDELAQVMVDIKKDLDAVKTIEREQFEADAITAKEEIESYITDLTLYSEANQAVIAKLIRDGKLDIDACDSVEAMQEIVEEVKQALDAILTLEEESILRAESFKNILSDEVAGSMNDVKIQDNKVVFDTKVVGKSSMVKFGSQDGKNHVAFDTKIIADYNDSVWDSFTIRFRAWDTNDGYKMVIKDSSIEVSKCKWGVDPEVVVQKNFGIKNGEETHLQILCSGWKKTVLINGNVVFTIDESERCVGYTYIETWQTGLTFIDPVYTEYPDADSFTADYGELLWKEEN